MGSLPFGNLPPHKPRRFVPAAVNLGKWEEIEPIFDRLEAEARGAADAASLERWLFNWSELNAALDEEGARRYIAMTCDTEDAEAEKAYLQFVEEIEPRLKPRQFKLAETYVAHSQREKLPQHRFAVFDRDTLVQVELFRPENVALETEEAKLSQQYQKLSGSLTVQFRGEEQTLVKMGRYLEETDRDLRREAWEAVARRRLQEAHKFEEIYDNLVRLRTRIARNAGFANYRDYAFRRMGRFDYTPSDCEKFHAAVDEEVMPALREIQRTRRERLGVDTLRPWDLSVDTLNRPPLRPFVDVEDMSEKTSRIFSKLESELAGGYELMRRMRLLDLGNRKGKAPGGYQSTLAEARVPFIFMNAVGLQRDVETILHEAGHAFHALATQSEDIHAYRNPPIEFCEVASMSMELLGGEFLEEFYSKADANRARKTHLEGILTILPWIATVDAFQHWIYTHPDHSREDRSAAWVALMERFAGDVDWSGYGQERALLWHRQLHIFTNAFYYIEYGIAQLGALQVWLNSKQNKRKALDAYKQALSLGGSRPLPELFAAAGCNFEFGAGTMRPLVGMIRQELKSMEAA